MAFIDGQNLYHSARSAFGYTYPNFDALALAERLCRLQGWQLAQVRFYTGIPTRTDNPRWHHFWSHKLAAMGRQGIHVYSRLLRYHAKTVRLLDGALATIMAGEEKGVDVRIALDVVRLAHSGEYDVAVLFSQDQDLSELAKEIRVIFAQRARWLKIACAFPSSPNSRNRRGINKTDWIKIDRATYDACLDRRDYRVAVSDSGGGDGPSS
ncbi:MAG: NYN domain-containing protein [Candidatus Methylomirabilis sp.]